MAFTRKAYTDEELLKLLTNQDNLALSLIFNQYHPFLCASAFRIVQDKEIAKDLVQDVFIHFWSRRSTIQITFQLKAYLHRSVVNRAFNHLEQKKLFVRATLEQANEVISPDTLSSTIEFKDLETALTQAIQRLPPVCRTVFTLSRYDELSNAEISDYLEISLKAVEKHMTKALKRLREVVRQYHS